MHYDFDFWILILIFFFNEYRLDLLVLIVYLHWKEIWRAKNAKKYIVLLNHPSCKISPLEDGSVQNQF